MSTPFRRTLRSLEADGAGINLVNMTVAAALLLAWMGWFFLARITLYEVSQPVVVTSDEMVEATFPAASQGKVQRGQLARITFDSPAAAGASVVQAVVVGTRPGEGGSVRAELLITQRGWAPPRPGRTLAGHAEVETERVSPASLVVRTVGNTGASAPSQP